MTSRKAGFDKSNPYRSAPNVRYVHIIKSNVELGKDLKILQNSTL